MADVTFTPNLRRHVDGPTAEVPGTTVAEVLARVFADHPRLRAHVVDDQGALRKHIVVFVDGEQVADREQLGDAVGARSELYVMQALSGG